MNRLTLVLPGIEGLAELREGIDAVEPDPPAWRTIRTRADFTPADGHGYEDSLLREFGVDGGIAALAVRADLPDIDHSGVWLRADPVYLRADRDHLRFFDAHVLGLEHAEAETLAAEIAAIYADLGWQLHVAAPDRWYLRIDVEPDIHTHPPGDVVGRVVDPFLPQGPDARRWHALLTEMQMVLHMSPVNAARERAGKLPVNSVWFWGNGPVSAPLSSNRRVYADDPLALTLAAGDANDLAVAELSAAGETCIVDTALQRPALYAEAGYWRDARAGVERRWIGPALAALRARHVDELRVIGSQGQVWTLRRPHLWRFWRR